MGISALFFAAWTSSPSSFSIENQASPLPNYFLCLFHINKNLTCDCIVYTCVFLDIDRPILNQSVLHLLTLVGDICNLIFKSLFPKINLDYCFQSQWYWINRIHFTMRMNLLDFYREFWEVVLIVLLCLYTCFWSTLGYQS